jgi:hypothetical protein
MASFGADAYLGPACVRSNRPTSTGVSDMGKGMDRKKETKKKPAKTKEEKRAEKKAKKA